MAISVEALLAKTVALIPARKGSKRIPHKNYADLGGQPLIWYSITYAQKFLPNDKIFVSTDDPVIEKISERTGVHTIRRPTELSSDFATSGEVIQHSALSISENADTEWIILLQPTNPFRPIKLIHDVLIEALQRKSRSILTVSPLSLKIGLLNEEEEFDAFNYSLGQRSQDIAPKYYFENGLMYLTHLSLAMEGYVMDSNPRGFPVFSWHGRIDIDEPEDLVLANALLPKYLHEIKQYEL